MYTTCMKFVCMICSNLKSKPHGALTSKQTSPLTKDWILFVLDITNIVGSTYWCLHLVTTLLLLINDLLIKIGQWITTCTCVWYSPMLGGFWMITRFRLGSQPNSHLKINWHHYMWKLEWELILGSHMNENWLWKLIKK
jgi:hypothetical protein